MDNLKKLWQWLVAWFIYLFANRYKVTVSFNKEYGDSDDKTYISKKIITKKEKHLKFVTHDKEVVEISSPSGLNYRITTI